MKKSKAMLCTILLWLLILAAFIALSFVVNENGIPLTFIFYPFCLFYSICKILSGFYEWLIKDDK